jgi:hypothetical protein
MWYIVIIVYCIIVAKEKIVLTTRRFAVMNSLGERTELIGAISTNADGDVFLATNELHTNEEKRVVLWPDYKSVMSADLPHWTRGNDGTSDILLIRQIPGTNKFLAISQTGTRSDEMFDCFFASRNLFISGDYVYRFGGAYHSGDYQEVTDNSRSPFMLVFDMYQRQILLTPTRDIYDIERVDTIRECGLDSVIRRYMPLFVIGGANRSYQWPVFQMTRELVNITLSCIEAQERYYSEQSRYVYGGSSKRGEILFWVLATLYVARSIPNMVNSNAISDWMWIGIDYYLSDSMYELDRIISGDVMLAISDLVYRLRAKGAL